MDKENETPGETQGEISTIDQLIATIREQNATITHLAHLAELNAELISELRAEPDHDSVPGTLDG